MTELLGGEGLTLLVDFNSLPTYLALGETRRMVDEVNVQVHWFPLVKASGNFLTGTARANENDPLAEYKARRARAKKQFSLRELQRNCERLGISVERGEREIDSTSAALGLLWLNKIRAKPEIFWLYAESVFSSTFRDAESVEDLDVIEKKLDQCSVVTTGFTEFGSGDVLSKVQEEILEAGIFESPAYLYEGDRFQGRQHLPLLHWLIGGRKGPPPV